MVAYSTTKAAVSCLSRGMAEATKGVPGVTVNSVLAGPTWTEGVEKCVPAAMRACIFPYGARWACALPVCRRYVGQLAETAGKDRDSIVAECVRAGLPSRWGARRGSVVVSGTLFMRGGGGGFGGMPIRVAAAAQVLQEGRGVRVAPSCARAIPIRISVFCHVYIYVDVVVCMSGQCAALAQRFLSVKEIGDVCVFLASPLAAAINGASQRAEGGNLRVV